MDQCVTVERELEKVLHKFSGYGQLCERGLEELIDYTGGLKHEILQSHGKAARVVARDRAHPPQAPRAQAGQEGASGRPDRPSPGRRDPQAPVTFPPPLPPICLEPTPTSLLTKSEREPIWKPILEPRVSSRVEPGSRAGSSHLQTASLLGWAPLVNCLGPEDPGEERVSAENPTPPPPRPKHLARD